MHINIIRCFGNSCLDSGFLQPIKPLCFTSDSSNGLPYRSKTNNSTALHHSHIAIGHRFYPATCKPQITLALNGAEKPQRTLITELYLHQMAMFEGDYVQVLSSKSASSAVLRQGTGGGRGRGR